MSPTGSTDDAMELKSEQRAAPPAMDVVASLKIPMPTLTETGVEAFLYAIEFWFEASGITSDIKKFNTICASIPPSKLLQLRPVIDSAPPTKKYDYIKRTLIEHFADSEQRRVQRVISDMPLGDRKPSELYSEMKRVAGNSLSQTILQDLWVSRLPTHIQPAIIAANVDVLEKIKIADAITESMHLQHNQIREITTPSAEMQSLQNQVAQLTRDMQKLLRNNSFRNRSRSRSPNINNDLCWYHSRFGTNATRCRQPCSFNSRSTTAATNLKTQQ